MCIRDSGVDDVFGRQPVATRDLGITRFAAAQQSAFVQQLGPGGPVNGAIDPTAAQQR